VSEEIGVRTFLLSAVILGNGMLSVGAAEEYPYRHPSYYRTAFMEAANKKCIRDGTDDFGSKTTLFCECKVALMAAFMTADILKELVQAGFDVTPRYQALADLHCRKLVTGQYQYR
jgi:hypothetical protein